MWLLWSRSCVIKCLSTWWYDRKTCINSAENMVGLWFGHCIHTRIVFVTSTARHAFLVWRWAGRLYPEPFYLLLLRFWALRMVSSTRAQKTYSPGRKSLNSQTRKCRYRHHRNRLGYRVMLWGWLVTYYNTSCNDMIYTVLSIQM